MGSKDDDDGATPCARVSWDPVLKIASLLGTAFIVLFFAYKAYNQHDYTEKDWSHPLD